jgi:parallel beta-helix repeat protein
VTSSIFSNNRETGIHIDLSNNNLIYNNYFNNTNNLTILNSRPNTWNVTKTEGTNIIGGNYLGGNYWSRPDGKGFSDTCYDNNGDRICDRPYVVDSNNTDYLPLARASLPAPTVSMTAVIAIVVSAVLVAVVAVARSARRKTVEHMLEDMNDFEFFRKVK